MKSLRNALICLMLAGSLVGISPLSAYAAASATTPVEGGIAPIQEVAPVEVAASIDAENDPEAPETQSTFGEYAKQEHEHMQEYIAWSQQQWAAHIDRTINFWKNHNSLADQQPETLAEDVMHPFSGSHISEHIRQSADRLMNHIEQSEKRLFDHVQWAQTRWGDTEEAE